MINGSSFFSICNPIEAEFYEKVYDEMMLNLTKCDCPDDCT